MKRNHPIIITEEVLDTLSTNLHASMRPLKAWLTGLNADGRSYSREEWSKLDEQQRYNIRQDQMVRSAWAQRNRMLSMNEPNNIMCLKGKQRKPYNGSQETKIVPVRGSRGKVLGHKLVFKDPTIREIGYRRLLDTTYAPITDPNTVLDVHTIYKNRVRNTIKWHNGVPFKDWLSLPTEDRYPLDPAFEKVQPLYKADDIQMKQAA